MLRACFASQGRQSRTMGLGHKIIPDLLCPFKSATTFPTLKIGQWKAACSACYLPVTTGVHGWDNVCLRRKGHGKKEEKEVPECAVLLNGCPPFLKEQFINYMLCVDFRRQIFGLSVPSHQWETEGHFVTHRFLQGPWMALFVQGHFRFQALV